MLLFGMRSLAICLPATYAPPVQSYAVKVFRAFFTGVYQAEDAAVKSLVNIKNVDTPVTMNQLKFLQSW